MKAKIAMVRMVRDDFHVLLMCNAMLSMGADPFAVVYQPTLRDGVTGQPFPAPSPFLVFCKVSDPAEMDWIDRAYAEAAYGKDRDSKESARPSPSGPAGVNP